MWGYGGASWLTLLWHRVYSNHLACFAGGGPSVWASHVSCQPELLSDGPPPRWNHGGVQRVHRWASSLLHTDVDRAGCSADSFRDGRLHQTVVGQRLANFHRDTEPHFTWHGGEVECEWWRHFKALCATTQRLKSALPVWAFTLCVSVSRFSPTKRLLVNPCEIKNQSQSLLLLHSFDLRCFYCELFQRTHV